MPTRSGGCPTGYCNMELNSTFCIIPLGIKFVLQKYLAETDYDDKKPPVVVNYIPVLGTRDSSGPL